MQVKIWGSRGSSPAVVDHARMLGLLEGFITQAKSLGLTNLDELGAAARSGKLGTPLSFGGHTPCTEVRHETDSVLVDMGTGLREFGSEFATKRQEFTVFLTHLHWDHLLGLPFFMPAFVPGYKIVIYHVHKNAPEHVRLLFNGVNFPVKWEQLGGTIEFRQLKLYHPVQHGTLTVTPFTLDHPGGCFGYRFEGGGKALVVGVDGEYTRVSRQQLGKDLPYYQNLDLLVFDAQYELGELLNKHDWGHSSAPIGIDLALREGIKSLLLLHHDPSASDAKLRAAVISAQKYARANSAHYGDLWRGQESGPKIISGYDGLLVDV